MGTFTIPFDFLVLEDLDADYERSVKLAIRTASLFQVSASTGTLGEYFLSARADPFAQHIQRVQFDGEAATRGCVKALVLELALDCQRRLLASLNARADAASIAASTRSHPG